MFKNMIYKNVVLGFIVLCISTFVGYLMPKLSFKKNSCGKYLINI